MDLEAQWEKLAEDGFAQIDARLPQDEKESEHFKSGLPPAPPKLDGVKKTKAPTPSEQRKNREKVKKHYIKNRPKVLQKKRDQRRNLSALEILNASYWNR